MTDWDFSTVEPPQRGAATLAFIGAGCRALWLLTAPFQLIANLNRRGDAENQEPCRTDCDAGVEASSIHIGGR